MVCFVAIIELLNIYSRTVSSSWFNLISVAIFYAQVLILSSTYRTFQLAIQTRQTGGLGFIFLRDSKHI